ncbi:MAG TPA: PepSY domain-containing protein [Casimicrobiaceae bacterium]|jgi:PepSY-associated transmembrane protein|nr:PepSY domain-containing protein [Casimicrobiaceae bacterium]
MSPRLFLLLLLRRWHARIGLSAVIFFLFLAVTGVALNHGSDLGLDARYVHAAWLARWYGLTPEPPRHAFRSGRHALIAANGRWLLDGRISGEKFPRPVGLVALPGMVIAASDGALYIYGEDGVLVDRLEKGALPGTPVQAIGSGARQFILRTASGTFASVDALSWRPAPRDAIAWSAPAELSAAERERYGVLLEPGISVQQLLLDLHSGRFAGRYGPLAVDLLAVFLAVLSLSGAWLFLKRRHRRERH